MFVLIILCTIAVYCIARNLHQEKFSPIILPLTLIGKIFITQRLCPMLVIILKIWWPLLPLVRIIVYSTKYFCNEKLMQAWRNFVQWNFRLYYDTSKCNINNYFNFIIQGIYNWKSFNIMFNFNTITYYKHIPQVKESCTKKKCLKSVLRCARHQSKGIGHEIETFGEKKSVINRYYLSQHCKQKKLMVWVIWKKRTKVKVNTIVIIIIIPRHSSCTGDANR